MTTIYQGTFITVLLYAAGFINIIRGCNWGRSNNLRPYNAEISALPGIKLYKEVNVLNLKPLVFNMFY